MKTYTFRPRWVVRLEGTDKYYSEYQDDYTSVIDATAYKRKKDAQMFIRPGEEVVKILESVYIIDIES